MSTIFKHANVVDFGAIIAENIRAEAGRQRINQSELARRLGLSRATVSYRWTGQRPWPLDDISKIAVILGTTPWALATPAQEYERGQANSLTPLKELPRLDSNQQPFDYSPWVDAGFAFAV